MSADTAKRIQAAPDALDTADICLVVLLQGFRWLQTGSFNEDSHLPKSSKTEECWA